jgi:hypothetical protein
MTTQALIERLETLREKQASAKRKLWGTLQAVDHKTAQELAGLAKAFGKHGRVEIQLNDGQSYAEGEIEPLRMHWDGKIRVRNR